MVSLQDVFRTCRFCDSLGEGAGWFFPEALACGCLWFQMLFNFLFLRSDSQHWIIGTSGFTFQCHFPFNYAEATVIPTIRMALAENATSTMLGQMARMMSATCCHATSQSLW